MPTKRIIKHGKEWLWPAHDEKLLAVFDQVEDIEHIMSFVDNRSLCIQAGGACGVWPAIFSSYFDRVMTFEPQALNFECLTTNIKGIKNIHSYNLALSDQKKVVSMKVDKFEANNCGAYYMADGQDVEAVKIDSFDVEPGLIQLDVEGFEEQVLIGALTTLVCHEPVIVIEEKPLPHMSDHLKARKFLQHLGYKEVGRINKDVIFKC